MWKNDRMFNSSSENWNPLESWNEKVGGKCGLWNRKGQTVCPLINRESPIQPTEFQVIIDRSRPVILMTLTHPKVFKIGDSFSPLNCGWTHPMGICNHLLPAVLIVVLIWWILSITRYSFHFFFFLFSLIELSRPTRVGNYPKGFCTCFYFLCYGSVCYRLPQ